MSQFDSKPDEAILFADRLVDKYSLLTEDNPVLAYPFDHGIFPAGWRSGMGNFFLSFLLFDLQKLTENRRYGEAALNLFNSSIREMRDGGVIIRDDEGCHLVEYASADVPYDQALFVLNGHLHALQSLILLQRYPEVRSAAKDLYKCALRKTYSIASEFHSDGYSYYQLNPRHVNQISYLIYEMLQFRALFMMTSDPFFAKEAGYRENVLKNAYPVRYVKDDGGYKYLVSLISFPHPYLLETFHTSLECIGVRSNRRYKAENSDRSNILTKSFLLIDADEKLKDCSLSSKHGESEFVLYSDLDGGQEINAALPIEKFALKAKAHVDATATESGILVKPGTNGVVELHLERPMSLNTTDLPYIRVCADGDSFRPVLRIRNQNNKTLNRYWPVIKGQGCKLIIFSVLGFHDYETENFDTLTMVGFRVLNDSDNTRAMDIPQVGLISNPFQLLHLISDPDNRFSVTP